MSATATRNEFESLLEYLKRTRGFDFTAYKPTSLMRRIRKRMQMVSIESYEDYIGYLEAHPDEFVQLFNTILINVTAFFRDPECWDYLSAEAVPILTEGKRDGEPIRVWSAGCATGEEAYTLAIVLAEAMEPIQFRERVKIYATDVSEEALAKARAATYTAKEVQGLSPALLEKYFEPVGSRYVFDRELRRSIIFGRHDLIQSAPISRLSLLVCRNCLMYFHAEAQARILGRFHFAIRDGGFLFLGKAETLLTRHSNFRPVDLKSRIFVKTPGDILPDRLALIGRDGDAPPSHPPGQQTRLREITFEAGPLPQVVVDLSGKLALANERARELFGIAPTDIGRPFQDVELSYRPVEMRALIEQVYARRRRTVLKDVEWRTSSGAISFMDVEIAPLTDSANNLISIGIVFTEVTHYHQLQEDLQRSHQSLEAAYEEMQSTNEELETTNEELQSTVEELETTNEELQSTNEELETMNEELQSTNEELETMNVELMERSEELSDANAFLASVLASLPDGVAVVDRDLRVLAWNHRAYDLWGLTLEEVRGKHLFNLDIGLPVDQLRQPIRTCLADDHIYPEVTVTATNRRGKTIRCQITCSPLRGGGKLMRGVILMMEDLGGVP